MQENQVNEFYHEKATIISENSYLIPHKVVMQNFRKGHYLIVAKKVEDSSNGDANKEEKERERSEEDRE